ncbi:LLM class flavin-dependent oxidoreductase [Actinosynnema sp. NPDC023587]|uniref:LLM class flavin-dependent oxidoreductase n=1 Tax=Actinosynnema sp. NPDC023587 TaxID=3154695 RepID=UPI0033D05ABF
MNDEEPSMSVEVGLAWNPVGQVQEGRDLLGVARSAGFDGFMVFDLLINVFPAQAWDADFTYVANVLPTPDQCLEFATLLGNLAPDAGPVQLAIGVTDPHRRHPAVLAQFALTLAQLTERAPVLGIGAGMLENLTPYGVAHDHQVDRVEEALRVIRLLLDGPGPHDFAGRHFTLDKAMMGLRAPEGRTPRLWVGAGQPRMLEITGRYADGWMPSKMMTPAAYARRLAKVRAAAVEAGRDPNAVVAAGWVPIVVADTDEAAHELLRVKAIRFTALHATAATWRRFGVPHPFGETYKGDRELLPHRLTRAEVEHALAEVTDELVATQAIIGSRQTVLDQIGDLIDAGMGYPMLFPLSAMASPEAAQYTAETLPWLRARLHTRTATESVPK